MTTYEIRDAVLSCEHVSYDVPDTWQVGTADVLCFRHPIASGIPRVTIVSMSTRTIDTEDDDTRYERDGWEGVAWVVDGPAWDNAPVLTLVLDEDGDEYECETDEYEEVERAGWVLCHMVGDDTRYEVEVSDLRPIADDAYCAGCGQIGCAHG